MLPCFIKEKNITDFKLLNSSVQSVTKYKKIYKGLQAPKLQYEQCDIK